MKRILLTAALALLSSSIGCKRSDSDQLAGVARIVSGNIHSLLPDRTPLRVTATSGSLEQRVADRFRSDYYLADAPIQVDADGPKVTLKGRVSDVAVKRRAVELAASTVGVESVDDEIVVAPH